MSRVLDTDDGTSVHPPRPRSGAPGFGGFYDRLRAAWRGFRDARLADPGFQAAAARSRLTRPIARANSRKLFDLCAGFVYAQTLRAAVELDLFSFVADGPVTPAETGRALALTEDAARRLLRACAALDLLEAIGDDRFALGPLGAALRGNPGALAMIRHHDAFYDDLRDPVALLRGETRTKLGALWPYGGKGTGASAEQTGAQADASAAYSALMAESQDMIAREILSAVDLSDARSILDMGGGTGRFLGHVARRYPDAALHLADLPDVAALAKRDVAAAGIADRLTIHPGDMLRDPLPRGVDCVTLVRILHDHDDATALALLERACAALRPGGTVLIAEPMAGDRGSARVADVYFGFYLLAMGTGRARSPREIARLCAAAGLVDVHEKETALPVVTRLVSARRPRAEA